MSFYYILTGVGCCIGLSSFIVYQKDFMELYEKQKGKLEIYKEIYRNSNWTNFAEFIVFKLRILAAQHLETGLITKRDGSGPPVVDLTYFEGSTKYKIRFIKIRGPCPFSQVTTTTTVYEIPSEDSRETSSISNILGNILNRVPAIANTSVEDVTQEIRLFAGPSHNFYGIPTTPKLLGYKNLTFHFRRGEIRNFSEDEVIRI